MPSFRWGIFRARPIVRQSKGTAKVQVSGSDSRSGARHVDPSGGGPKVFERLLEILYDFADWLGLLAHDLLPSPTPVRW